MRTPAHCPSCDELLEDRSKFCAACGQPVSGPAATVDATIDAPPPSSSENTAHRNDSTHGRFVPGQQLGDRYRIVALLGRGGMGDVYRADDLELGQSVALKFIPERVANDPETLDRFRREVRTARDVAHPNVCRAVLLFALLARLGLAQSRNWIAYAGPPG